MGFRPYILLIMICAGCALSPTKPERIDQHLFMPEKHLWSSSFALDLPNVRKVDRLGDLKKEHFPTFAQCQIRFECSQDSITGLSVAESSVSTKINKCLQVAIEQNVDVLILPELSLAVAVEQRHTLIEQIKQVALEENMIVVAGSFYDENRQSRIPIIGPGWEEYGYKLRPSRFEASPREGLGMEPASEMLLIETAFGRILPLTCVDLISDSAQYVVRDLSNKGELDVLININYNPAAWEFLVEVNGLVRRHPLFASITNVASFAPTLAMCAESGDYGYCAGNSAIFASLRTKPSDCPNCIQKVTDLIEPAFMAREGRHIAFDRLSAVVPALQEGMLIYDLNLRLLREPLETNAPDQGYPSIRNLRRIEF